MICFCWSGFPQYAARCICAYTQKTDERVVVVASRPRVPIKGMDEVCGCKVYWIDYDESRSLCDIAGEMPRCIFLGGWNISVFVRFREEVRASGGRTIAMCDNNFVFSFKECIKALRFRLKIRSKYDGYFVPGASGVKLLRFYGVPMEKIATGMYSADSALFMDGPQLAKRGKKIIYVGQFIERKNVRRLVQAFQRANSNREWTLDMYGSGPLKDELLGMSKQDDTIHIHDFCQPEELAAKYREARVFCLPSLWEHWGLVVHEAALSGCVLLLGNRTGAADDLLGDHNGWTFNPYRVSDMAKTFRDVMNMDDEALKDAQEESLARARGVSLENFTHGCQRLIDNVCGGRDERAI